MKAQKKASALAGQPWDSWLLKKSALYRRSRRAFLAIGGFHVATFLSSPRSLASLTLIEKKLQYNPVADELEWSQKDRIQRNDRAHFELLRTFTNNVYHEQNHRTLWEFMQTRGYYCPGNRGAARRYLNFTESLIVILDFALGDELGLKVGAELYSQGVIYSPGSDFRKIYKPSKREYRNYLQAVAHAVFLRLEGMHPEDIPIAIHKLFQVNGEGQVKHAINRAFLLDALFVELTNPVWQRKNLSAVIQRLGAPKKGRQAEKSLVLPNREPLNHAQAYLITENWLEFFGL